MKWLFSCMLALLMVTSAMAGEDPYVAIVGNDITANFFYLSPPYEQFLLDQSVIGIPVTGEFFQTNAAIIQPEICDTLGTATGPLNWPPFTFRGNFNGRVTAGNAGWYNWGIYLPKKPSGEINLCIRCGVIKPDAFKFEGFLSVLTCAAETGELLNQGGICARQMTVPGRNVLNPQALPSIEATANAGPHAASGWSFFHLTAFRNPGTYNPDFSTSGAIVSDGEELKVLDGMTGARILLKSCFDKCIVVKLPVTGQINALGETEQDLEPGDKIIVTMFIPKANTVDIYCNAESLHVMGIGEDPF
jgi:hypothetical protein